MAREKNERQRLFVDMDGTLGVFTPVDEMETLYEKGYFEKIKPHENVVGGINRIIDNRSDIEVYILSAYLTDSDYALAEKNVWLDKYLPNIDNEHRVFVPCGSNKRDFIPDGIRDNDYLIDDYTENLNSWLPARGIKLLNGINHTRGTWEYDRISYNKPASVLSDDICAVMTGDKHIFDDRPILASTVSDPYRATLVVNLYAGAGAGKTTCAWLIAGELKKRNIVTEYVSEYAKELVWDNNTALLNGSYDNQLSVLSEQYRRIHRLIGKVDVVVTDSPLLLSGMYVKENHDKFNAVVLSMYNECDNFNLFINRGEYYEQAGRIHSLEQSVEIDNNIKAFLDNNNVYFGTYQHSTLDIVVNNIQTSLERLQRGIAPNTRANGRSVTLDNNDFQERVRAAQDMRDEARGYGLRLKVNGDGTITFYHGTSKNNANLIQDSGFDSQTYFSHTKKGAEYYANQKNKDGIVIEIKADARDIEFAAGGAEFYSPNRLINNNGVWKSDSVRIPPERSSIVTIDEIDIKNEVRGSHSGQTDLELIASLGASVIGGLRYSEYEGVPHIQMIETAAGYKRQGVATALLRELQSLYPDTGIEFGMSTDDGTKLLEAISYRVDNEEYIRLNNELSALTKEQKDIEQSLSSYYDLPADEIINDYNDNVLTDDTDIDISAQGDRWNAIHDRLYEIEQSMQDMKPYHTFIRTGSEENINMDNPIDVPLSQQQEIFFSNSKIRDEHGNLIKMYHGTPYANYASFHAGTHFTPSKDYADRYHNPSASSTAHTIRTDTLNPSTFEVFLNITKPFDTRNQLERDIFYNEYLGKYSMSTAPLSDSGLADWTEAENLQEFLIENGYDYDGLILVEGGDGGYGDVVTDRGLSYVCFYPNQAKLTHNLSPTLDDSFSDSRLDSDRALSTQQEEYFSNSVVRNEDGSLTVLYHGTGTEITQFDTQFTGQGNDQYGSGFYFTTDYNTASGYTMATLTGDDNKPIDKLGGTDNPTVLNVYINLANPIIINGMEQANLSEIRVTERQARDILRRLPSLYHGRENEVKPNPLGDYSERFWTAPLNTRRDYERLIDVMARDYFSDTDLLTLDRIFVDYPTEFRQAVKDVCGYDGVIVNFEKSKHVIAWFPEQIKDVLCKEPALTPLLNDDAILKTAMPSMTYKVHANPRYDGTNSRTFVQAYEIVGNAELIPRDILYMGTPENAIAVTNALVNGDITPDEARTRWDNETESVEITNRAFDDEGYLHFTAETGGYSLDGLFRVYDPSNGNDLSIVSIDNGDRHPIITEKWNIIETELREYSAARYAELTHGDNEEKEIKEMADNLQSIPVGEIARLDYIRNSSTDAQAAMSESRMLEAVLASVPQDEHDAIYSRYRNVYLDANALGQFPKIAILQLREGEENHFRRFESMGNLEQRLQETPNCDNYEVVYIRTVAEPTETESARQAEADKLFTELNADTLRPRNYYGHSLSVSDIVVFSNDNNEQHAYFVDSEGYTKLPDDFLSLSMIAKIKSGAVIEHEASLLERITAYQAENVLQLTDNAVTDRHFQITSQYDRIFEMAARRGTIMDMDDLGYAPAQIDGFSDDFLMFRAKDNENDTFGYDGWDAVNDFINDVRTLASSYTLQELQDRANGDYGTIEYGAYGDREVQTAIAAYTQDRVPLTAYRRQVQAIYDYEVANDIPENDRMTKLDDTNTTVAKPFYMVNDPSVMDRAVSDRRIGISDASIAARYAEIHAERTSTDRSSSFTVDLLNRGSDNISVVGHTGTWYVIDNETIDGKNLFLLESEQHGDEAAALIVDDSANLVLDDVYNGFDDYREQISEPLKAQVIEAMAAAGYTYNETESGDGYLNFNGESGSMNFEHFSEAAEWLNGVTFDDPDISKAVERIMHPDNEPVTVITDERTRRIADILAINTKYDYDAIVQELVDREAQRADLPINADFRDYTVEELREAVDFERNYTPIPNRYYEPALDFDGTAEELYIQARNGYIENPDALHRLGEILTQEGKADEAERVGYMEERQREDTSLYSVAQMKLDFMDGYGGIDDVAISDSANLTVAFEPRDNNVLVSLSQTWQDGNEDVYSTGANAISLDEFKGMSRADFERFVGEVSAYSMVEQDRTPREPIQELTHGDNDISVSPFPRTAIQNENTRYIFDYDDTLNIYNVTREQLLSVGESRSFNTMSVEEAVKELSDLKSKGFLEFRNTEEISWYATTENNTPYVENWEIENGFLIPIESYSVSAIAIDGYDCVKLDEWVSGSATFILGRNAEDNTFYHAQVSDTDGEFGGVYAYEYSEMPSHDDVESSHIDNISAMAIDRHEAEYGADGRRAFPNLNNEPPQTYREAVTLIEGMSNTQIANMGHDEASNIMGLLDSEWLVIESILNEVAEDGYDETYTEDYVQQLGYDADYYRQLSEYVEELAIGQYMRGELREGERPVRQIFVPQAEVTNSVELVRSVAAVAAPVEIDSSLPPKDQLKQRLENGVRSVIDSEQFKNWLSTGGKLFYNNYSFRNAMLVWLQKPEATYVMGYEKWKEFGRNVGQGAQGAKILIPLMASEKFKGGLFRSIKNNLNEQLSKDPSLTEATYRLGSSNLDFTMNRANHLIGFKSNGVEQQIFGSDDETKRFIDRAIIGKVPTGFTVGTVFDAKDVIIPDYLWLKQGFTKDEIALDDKGNPTKNKRGETKIINTPERQARFQTDLDISIAAKDPVKMQALFDACVSVSEKKGVPVSVAEVEGSAKGYYKRELTENTPNGFIVIDKDLEITEKCAVLLHEMGHADLHKNIEALAKSMGEEKIPREMREVQAEAVAFATASTFGIETDTSSFKYLAVYSRGFELQDFQKSLDLIYKETQALTKDIKAELDIRGLNLDLTEKPKELLSKETLETLSSNYMDFAVEHGSKIQAAINELPSLVKQSAGNPDLMDILKYQKQNLDSQKADVDTMLNTVESLNAAVTRETQDEAVNTLDSTMNRVSGNENALEVLSERYVVIAEQARGGLKVDFEKNPRETLEAMKKDFPALTKLSEPQLQYISTSKFVSREFTKLLRDNPQEFVNKVTERAALIPKVASKNGTFVEISFCEQWTDKPFFENGTLCSPKIANVTVTGCEAQAKGFREDAEKRGEYFPLTKCEVSVFTPSKDGNMVSLNTRVDIGGNGQTNLKDHLGEICQRGAERKEVLANFTEALSERADKRKIVVQDLSVTPQNDDTPDKAVAKEGNTTREVWGEQIKDAKDKAAQEQKEKAAEKAQGKNNHDRT